MRRENSKTRFEVQIRGYMNIRELQKYLPLSRKTLYRYAGKYGFEKLPGFPERENIGQDFRWKIYGIDMWLGRIKPGEEIKEIEMRFKEKMIDLDKAGDILEYTEDYIRVLCKNGEIPCYKTKKKWLFLPSELDQWLDDNEYIRKGAYKGTWNR